MQEENEHSKKEACEKFKTWLVSFLTDLAVGLILLLVSRLFK